MRGEQSAKIICGLDRSSSGLQQKFILNASPISAINLVKVLIIYVEILS
jgi:hypothetical protein